MRKRTAVSIIVWLVLAAASAQAGPAFSLKLYGGAGLWTTGGDFKELFESTAERWRAVGYTGTFDLAWKPWSFEGGIQAVAMFTPRFGLAAGIGYQSKTIGQDSKIDYGTGTVDQINSYKVRSIPVSLDALYALTTGSVRIVLSAGATYYSSQVDTDENGLYSEPARPGKPNWRLNLENIFTSDRRGAIGAQMGVSAEIKLGGSAALCLDVVYKIAAFDDVRGSNRGIVQETWTGGGSSSDTTEADSRMWYGTSSIAGHTWHYLDFGKATPLTGDEERLFKINLGGPVLRLGIKIGL